MGTRRPLIVQMVHDPSASEPRCRLQDEESDEYGPPIVPETAVAEAIMERTETHLRKLGGVPTSSKPIVMRAEYAYCPNLTIIDTPGFILKAKNGEADSTPDDIMKMVKEQASPPHRLILFLQQSSVEWASSLWLHVVQQVDPQYQRTVIVASKFDNRLKEFAERWEVDKYLSATGYLPSNVKPFFVALPKDRKAQSSAEWRRQMQEVDVTVFRHLRESIRGGFDEERFAGRIGFGNLRRFLEEELARRYREAAPATLALLQERCQAVAGEFMQAEARLKSAEDVASLRRAAMKHAASMASQVEVILRGSTEPDPAQHGTTTEEERVLSRVTTWPGVGAPVRPPNAGLKLFGGAAFERCLNEFQEAAHALSFPAVARDKVANVLLAYKGKNNYGGPARAAEDIARQSAREMLGPLLDTACRRLGFVIRRVVDIAADTTMASGPSKDILQPYVAFHAALRAAHQNFIGRLEDQARTLVRHHLDAATSQFALTLMASAPDFWQMEEEPYHPHQDHDENEDPGHAQDRVPLRPTQTTVPETPSPDVLLQQGAGGKGHTKHYHHGLGPGRQLDDASPGKGRATKTQRLDLVLSGKNIAEGRGSYEDVIRYAERLFARIRQAVACQAAPSTLKSAFLDPVHDSLEMEVSLELFARTDVDFMSMFAAAGALASLQAKRDSLQRRVEGLVKCKNEFQELARCL